MTGERSFWRIGGMAIVFLLIPPRALAQGSSESVQSIVEALRAHEYDHALHLAEAELQSTPEDPQLLTLEGLALSGLGKRKEALREYDAALRLTPDYIPALEGAAQIEYETGGERSVTLLNRLLVLRPDDPTAHGMLAAIDYRRGDCASAVKHFQAGGAEVSSEPVALEEYGDCLVRIGQAGEAVSVFLKLSEMSPGDARATYNVAVAQIAAGKSQEAIQTLQPLLEAKSPDSSVLDLASEAYESLGETPQAVKLLRQAIILGPDNPKLYVDFATLSLNHSSYQVGIDMINAGLSRLPNSAALYAARGVLYVQLAEYEKGEADFETAERLNPTQAFGSDAYGLAKFQQNNLDDALASVRSKLKSHPGDAFLNYLLAQILTQRGATPGTPNFKEAVDAAEKAVRLDPNLTEARDVLAGLYLKSGHNEESIHESRQVLKKEPDDPEALYHLMQALRRTGKVEEIPDLVKRLAAAQSASSKKELSQNRFKLVEPGENQPAETPK